MAGVEKMEGYLVELEEHSRQSKNDIRWGQIVLYINTFLNRFGKEKVYLVGSTGEKTKLTFSKDDGDGDFLMVSGKYEVDIEQLEFNENIGCYVRIRANEKSRTIGLEIVNDRYISADTLRDIKPELFTILRAIYIHVSASRDRLPERGIEDTVISVPSKVGLASTRYRKLKLDEALIERLRRNHIGHVISEKAKQALMERWKEVPRHEDDMKTLRRVFKILQLAVNHKDIENEKNNLAFLVGLLDGIFKQLPSATNSPVSATDSVDLGTQEEAPDHFVNDNETEDEDLNLSDMRNTYREKFHMDFVPAIKLNGKLELMKQWKQRAELAGMENTLVDEIYESDIFVVSRVSPIEPHVETDFCLSFNRAEMKLASNMTTLQRKVFLLMKAYLKGLFEIRHAEKNRNLQLKTYHIKNTLFWLFELNLEISFAEDTVENVLTVLQRAMEFLNQKIEERMLPHYFVRSNLFAEFDNDDYHILRECVHKVLRDPVESLKSYFDLNDGKPCDIVLTSDEVKCLMEISSDGGWNKHVHQLGDALVDLQRGFNEGPRDEEERAPIKEAILDIVQLFLADEKSVDTQIFQQINMFLTQGRTNSIDEINAKIRDVATLLHGIGILFPNIKQFLERFNGRPGLERFLRGAFTGTPVDFSRDLEEQILETINRYLECQDEEEDDIAGELTYKLVGYFSGRTEYPRLSGLV